MKQQSSIKIDKKDYEALKALAKRRGQFLYHVISEAVRKYVADSKQGA